MRLEDWIERFHSSDLPGKEVTVFRGFMQETLDALSPLKARQFAQLDYGDPLATVAAFIEKNFLWIGRQQDKDRYHGKRGLALYHYSIDPNILDDFKSNWLGAALCCDQLLSVAKSPDGHVHAVGILYNDMKEASDELCYQVFLDEDDETGDLSIYSEFLFGKASYAVPINNPALKNDSSN